MPQRIRPLADRIVVRKDVQTDRKTDTGLFIPESVTEKGGASTGVVLDVGEGIYNEKGEFLRPLNIKRGERIIFGKYAGVEAHLGQDELLLMQEIDILGIVEDA